MDIVQKKCLSQTFSPFRCSPLLSPKETEKKATCEDHNPGRYVHGKTHSPTTSQLLHGLHWDCRWWQSGLHNRLSQSKGTCREALPRQETKPKAVEKSEVPEATATRQDLAVHAYPDPYKTSCKAPVYPLPVTPLTTPMCQQNSKL